MKKSHYARGLTIPRSLAGWQQVFMSVKCITAYDTYFVNPKVKTKERTNDYTFRQASAKDTAAILAFLNEEGKKKDLFPVVKSLDDFYNLHIEDFYILEDGQEMKAQPLRIS